MADTTPVTEAWDTHKEWVELNQGFVPTSPRRSCYGPELSEQQRDFAGWTKVLFPVWGTSGVGRK